MDSYFIKKIKNRRAAGAGGGGSDPWIYYPDVSNGKFERRRVSDTAGTGIEEVYAHADITTYGVRPFAIDISNGWLAWTNDIGSGNGNRSNFYDLDGETAYLNQGNASWWNSIIEDTFNTKFCMGEQDNIDRWEYSAGSLGAFEQGYIVRGNGYWANGIGIYESGATPKFVVSTPSWDTFTGIRRTWDGHPSGENGEVFTATQSKNPVHIAVDEAESLAFFSDHTDNKIYSIDPTGDLGQALVEIIAITGGVQGLDVDPSAQKLYYCHAGDNELRRCNYDGSGDESVWAHADRFRVVNA